MLADQPLSGRSSRSSSSSGSGSRTHSRTREPPLVRHEPIEPLLSNTRTTGDDNEPSRVVSSPVPEVPDPSDPLIDNPVGSSSQPQASPRPSRASPLTALSPETVPHSPIPSSSEVKAEPTDPAPSQLLSEPQILRVSDVSSPVPDGVEALGSYTCPICFYPPKNATLTPCGHVCCGKCLWDAVKSGMARGGVGFGRGAGGEGPRSVLVADCNSISSTLRRIRRCPVCRAPIVGWDGRGGGVIGLRPAAIAAPDG